MKRKIVFSVAIAALVLCFVLLGIFSQSPVAYAQATSTATPTNTPTSTPTNTPTNTPTYTPFPMVQMNVFEGAFRCNPFRGSSLDCIQINNGAKMHFYKANGLESFSVNGETGAVSAGSLTLSTPLAAGAYIAPTSVPTATPQPTFAYIAPTPQPTATPLGTGSVTAGMIVNPQRSINLPLYAFVSCDFHGSNGALMDFTSGADTSPDFGGPFDNFVPALKFDVDGGNIDIRYACSQIVVPPDYVSDASVRLRLVKESETATNNERIELYFIDDVGATGVQCLSPAFTGTAMQTVVPIDCTPPITTGHALGMQFRIVSDDTNPDDPVTINGIEFIYTATQ